MKFRIISLNGRKKFDLHPGKRYKIPEGANYLHLKGGKISFGSSPDERPFIKTKKGRFIRIPDPTIPENATVIAVAFPEYKKTRGGHCYGQPEWVVGVGTKKRN